jgi:hypothetical protein
VAFKAETRSTVVGERCFSECSIGSICLPRSAEILGESWRSNTTINAIPFENNSEMKRIEEFCFTKCKLSSICIPAGVDPIDRNAFFGNAIDSISVDRARVHFTVINNILVEEGGVVCLFVCRPQ